MNVLVTGGSGFIGSHLVDRLLIEGHTVKIIDRSIKYQNLKNPKDITIYHENILGNISDLFKGIDVVFHLAALTRPQWSITFPLESAEVNIQGTLKVLEHCRNNKVKRIVFMSSSNIYGDVDLYPTPEGTRPNPMNMYALSKLIGEQCCRLYSKLYGLEWNACRPFNAYGKRMPISGIYTSAAATFINGLEKDLLIETFGSGEQRRDYIFIDDVVDQLMLMATSEVCNEAFNCGSGTNTSINELLEMISKIFNKTPRRKKHLAQLEPDQTLADITKAYAMLGWKPKVNLEEGLRKTIK